MMVKVGVRGSGIHYVNECPHNCRATSICVFVHLLREADCWQHAECGRKRLSLISEEMIMVCLSACVHEPVSVFCLCCAAVKLVCVQLYINDQRLVCSM